MSSVYLDIALDGRILYDPLGYAAEKLATLRRIMDKAGLYRQRTSSGDMWEWRDPPRGPWAIEWEHRGMASREDARYHLQLAEGFLEEARQDVELRRQ